MGEPFALPTRIVDAEKIRKQEGYERKRTTMQRIQKSQKEKHDNAKGTKITKTAKKR
jgi:hypothetical protein